jgi:hypothetical protein
MGTSHDGDELNMARRGNAEKPSDPLPEPDDPLANNLLPEPDDPLTNVDYLRPSRQRNRRDAAAMPHVSVICDGEALAVYPDDKTVRAWNDEGWGIVRAGFARGDRLELVLTKSPDDYGIGIRRYRRQRVSVHVSIKSKGRARQREPLGARTVRRVGDSFFFDIAEQVVIEPTQIEKGRGS